MDSLELILGKYLPKGALETVNNRILGNVIKEIQLPGIALDHAEKSDIELKAYDLSLGNDGRDENVVSQMVRVGVFQNAIVENTNEPIKKQRNSLIQLGKDALLLAYQCGVKVFCFQEIWNMPWGFCTQKKLPWTEFAEDALEGPTTLALKTLAKDYDMVIVSSILERDKNDFLWNTCSVIDANGDLLGLARKNHIPISGKFNETSYYKPSSIGVPVFDTKHAKIGLTICYDRHQLQNWFTHRLNKAQIVFNPTATVQTFSEPFWGVEARNAAVANGYFVCAINRVGTESFRVGGGKEEIAGPFFGSSYVTAPNGLKTPGLSLHRNGLLVSDLDLATCVEFQENPADLLQLAEEFRKYP